MSFARNVNFQLKKGKDSEFTRVFESDVLPILKKQKGFKEELTLVNPEHAMGISVWEDRQSAEQYASTTYPQVLQKLNTLIEGTPRVESFEVAASTID